jgi:protein gp37
MGVRGYDGVVKASTKCTNGNEIHERGLNGGTGGASPETGGPSKTGAGAETGGPSWTGVVNVVEEAMGAPLGWKKPRRVFVNSMGDLFHEGVADGVIAHVWQTMFYTPQHKYLILTKREERMLDWVRRWCDLTGDDDPMEFKNARGPEAVRAAHKSGRGQLFADFCQTLLDLNGGTVPDGCAFPTFDWERGWKYWPAVLPNVILGVSVEDQKTWDARVPELLRCPAARRVVSIEPMLGPINTRGSVPPRDGCDPASTCSMEMIEMLDGVIVGGESGPGARPCDVEWPRSVRDQCLEAGVAFYMKQAGANCITRTVCNMPPGDWPEGTRFKGLEPAGRRVLLRDRKGGDMSEWPEDLRVREDVWGK